MNLPLVGGEIEDEVGAEQWFLLVIFAEAPQCDNLAICDVSVEETVDLDRLNDDGEVRGCIPQWQLQVL